MTGDLKPLWRCPKCGNTFVTRNMWHSCGTYELDDLFARSEPHVRGLFDRFVELVEACGPVTIIPQKTRIAFQARVRFAGCVPRVSYLRCAFWFTREHASPRFEKIERYTPNAFGHFVLIHALDELDDEFAGWVREAYAIGQQKHLD